MSAPARFRDAGVVVIGSGFAGRMAAIRASERGPVLLVTDGPLDRCNSIMAQGGVHAPVDGEASYRPMVADIVASARVPVDVGLVETFVRGAGAVTALVQQWGLEFDREDDGSLRRRIAGGMSEPRVLTAGDEIGLPLLRVLGDRLDAADVTVATHTRVDEVDPGRNGVTLTLADGSTIATSAVVIATGGGAYGRAVATGERSTNPRNTNHVMFEHLVARGAQTSQSDFWQWQPFGLVDGPKGPPARCVPETVAALGPRLMDRFGETLADLPMDRLALTERMFAAADRAILGDAGRGFLLTLSDLDSHMLRRSYPKLARTLDGMEGVGSDVLVWPFLHYQLGGVAFEADGTTSLRGVFAAGEVTGGLHGRNRLMGAGITDALVHGWSAGAAAAEYAFSVSR